ncbi:hypothetical protein ACUTF1_30085, partial [Burkholderia pseudomallei]
TPKHNVSFIKKKYKKNLIFFFVCLFFFFKMRRAPRRAGPAPAARPPGIGARRVEHARERPDTAVGRRRKS